MDMNVVDLLAPSERARWTIGECAAWLSNDPLKVLFRFGPLGHKKLGPWSPDEILSLKTTVCFIKPKCDNDWGLVSLRIEGKQRTGQQCKTRYVLMDFEQELFSPKNQFNREDLESEALSLYEILRRQSRGKFPVVRTSSRCEIELEDNASRVENDQNPSLLLDHKALSKRKPIRKQCARLTEMPSSQSKSQSVEEGQTSQKTAAAADVDETVISQVENFGVWHNDSENIVSSSGMSHEAISVMSSSSSDILAEFGKSDEESDTTSGDISPADVVETRRKRRLVVADSESSVDGGEDLASETDGISVMGFGIKEAGEDKISPCDLYLKIRTEIVEALLDPCQVMLQGKSKSLKRLEQRYDSLSARATSFMNKLRDKYDSVKEIEENAPIDEFFEIKNESDDRPRGVTKAQYKQLRQLDLEEKEAKIQSNLAAANSLLEVYVKFQVEEVPAPVRSSIESLYAEFDIDDDDADLGDEGEENEDNFVHSGLKKRARRSQIGVRGNAFASHGGVEAIEVRARQFRPQTVGSRRISQREKAGQPRTYDLLNAPSATVDGRHNHTPWNFHGELGSFIANNSKNIPGRIFPRTHSQDRDSASSSCEQPYAQGLAYRRERTVRIQGTRPPAVFAAHTRQPIMGLLMGAYGHHDDSIARTSDEAESHRQISNQTSLPRVEVKRRRAFGSRVHGMALGQSAISIDPFEKPNLNDEDVARSRSLRRETHAQQFMSSRNPTEVDATEDWEQNAELSDSNLHENGILGLLEEIERIDENEASNAKCMARKVVEAPDAPNTHWWFLGDLFLDSRIQVDPILPDNLISLDSCITESPANLATILQKSPTILNAKRVDAEVSALERLGDYQQVERLVSLSLGLILEMLRLLSNSKSTTEFCFLLSKLSRWSTLAQMSRIRAGSEFLLVLTFLLEAFDFREKVTTSISNGTLGKIIFQDWISVAQVVGRRHLWTTFNAVITLISKHPHILDPLLKTERAELSNWILDELRVFQWVGQSRIDWSMSSIASEASKFISTNILSKSRALQGESRLIVQWNEFVWAIQFILTDVFLSFSIDGKNAPFEDDKQNEATSGGNDVQGNHAFLVDVLLPICPVFGKSSASGFAEVWSKDLAEMAAGYNIRNYVDLLARRICSLLDRWNSKLRSPVFFSSLFATVCGLLDDPSSFTSVLLKELEWTESKNGRTRLMNECANVVTSNFSLHSSRMETRIAMLKTLTFQPDFATLVDKTSRKCLQLIQSALSSPEATKLLSAVDMAGLYKDIASVASSSSQAVAAAPTEIGCLKLVDSIMGPSVETQIPLIVGSFGDAVLGLMFLTYTSFRKGNFLGSIQSNMKTGLDILTTMVSRDAKISPLPPSQLTAIVSTLGALLIPPSLLASASSALIRTTSMLLALRCSVSILAIINASGLRISTVREQLASFSRQTLPRCLYELIFKASSITEEDRLDTVAIAVDVLAEICVASNDPLIYDRSFQALGSVRAALNQNSGLTGGGRMFALKVPSRFFCKLLSRGYILSAIKEDNLIDAAWTQFVLDGCSSKMDNSLVAWGMALDPKNLDANRLKLLSVVISTDHMDDGLIEQMDVYFATICASLNPQFSDVQSTTELKTLIDLCCSHRFSKSCAVLLNLLISNPQSGIERVPEWSRFAGRLASIILPWISRCGMPAIDSFAPDAAGFFLKLVNRVAPVQAELRGLDETIKQDALALLDKRAQLHI